MKQQGKTVEKNSSAARFSSEKLRGILLPFPTAFDNDGEIDAHALRSNIERWNATGVAGYVALGSTGERVHLDEREYIKVIDLSRERISEEMLFIVGAGQQSTRATANEVRRVAEAGADAVLLITPHFYRGAMTQSALYSYYMAVADGAPVPVLLYSMPDLTGIAIAPETIARLAEHENIIGVKDSSGDIINFAETVRLVPQGFAVLTGSGPLLYAALCAGAAGAILAVGCVAPKLAVNIYGAVKAGEHARAREWQQRLTPLALAVTKRYGIGGLKAALDLIGYNGGYVRAPLQDANEEARRDIARLLEEYLFRDEAAGSDGQQYRLAGATE